MKYKHVAQNRSDWSDMLTEYQGDNKCEHKTLLKLYAKILSYAARQWHKSTVCFVKWPYLEPIFIENCSKAWKSRATGELPIFKTSVLASNTRSFHSETQTPACCQKYN